LAVLHLALAVLIRWDEVLDIREEGRWGVTEL